MIRTYSDKRIYKNFKIALCLSIVSLVIAVASAITHACAYFLRVPKPPINYSEILDLIFFYFFVFIVPITVLSCSAWSLTPRKQNKRKKPKETKWKNDFARLLVPIIVSFTPYMCLAGSFASFLISLCFGHPETSELADCARMCGYMFPSHAFTYMADVFLKSNCTLILQEWKEDPPEYFKEKLAEKTKKREEKLQKKAERAEQKAAEEKQRNEAICRSLLQTCGMRFFIKYYRQIKTLPLRDVVISETYSTEERDERVNAAKKIMDLNLTDAALHTIIEDYGNGLEREEIERAKELLADLVPDQSPQNVERDDASSDNTEASDDGWLIDTYDPYDE